MSSEIQGILRGTNKTRALACDWHSGHQGRVPACGGTVSWPSPLFPMNFRYPGRKPVDDRKALTGILFVLKTGIPWEDLPVEMGCGCGMTCWRRLQAAAATPGSLSS